MNNIPFKITNKLRDKNPRGYITLINNTFESSDCFTDGYYRIIFRNNEYYKIRYEERYSKLLNLSVEKIDFPT